MSRKSTSFIAVFAAVCVVLSAFALPISVTLDSSQSIKEQVKALNTYIAQLPENQREQWLDELDIISAGHKIVYSKKALDPSADMVYIAPSGDRYHCDAACNGLRFAKSISGVIKTSAKEMGRTPCKLCYPTGDSN